VAAGATTIPMNNKKRPNVFMNASLRFSKSDSKHKKPTAYCSWAPEFLELGYRNFIKRRSQTRPQTLARQHRLALQQQHFRMQTGVGIVEFTAQMERA
jgi:hypothetical protein